MPPFLERHSNWLKVMWSHLLEAKKVQAENPALKEQYFELFKRVLEESNNDGNGLMKPGFK